MGRHPSAGGPVSFRTRLLLGILVAQRIYLKISRDLLMKAVAVMLLASGSSLLWRALG